MQRKKGSSRHGRHHSGLARQLVLAVLILFLLAGAYGCTAQRLVYTARGTMIFLPAGSLL